MFLLPLMLLLNHPNAAAIMPEKIIIKRPMRKSVVIKKEDIIQISVISTRNRFLHWLMRLVYIVWIPLYFIKEIMTTLCNLKILSTDYVELSQFLRQLAVLAMFLVMFYNSELMAPYQQILKVTTRSSLKLWLFTDDPEELTKLLNFGI